ncbi:MAG: DsrE family protein [Thermoleophilia bacterium]|nr:DsrE family protein [Thermoleophilia bacterium]
MTRSTLFAVFASGLAGAALSLALAAGAGSGARASAAGTLKAVVHVNFPDTGRQGHGLKNVENVLKALGPAEAAEVVVVCHGGGIGLVETARTEHAPGVKALVEKGVRFVACENTMRSKSIRKEDLLPGVGTVPSGALEVIRRQHDGFAYFRP